jgi:VanZ family protein
MAGDLGSGKNTLGLLNWLLSWFVDLGLAQLKMINFYVRKTGHFLAYGLMYVLWFRAFRGQAHFGPWRACLWSLGFCLLFSSLDEGRQWFYPTRGASISDVILDMSGASLAALIAGAVWQAWDLAAPISVVNLWRKPYVLNYWLPPVLWSLAVLAVQGLVPVEITLGPLKWFVSWFAIVDSYELKILNLYLWKTGQALTFGVLYVLWFRAFQGYTSAGRNRACLSALGLCLYVALLQELLQIFARTRGGSMYEVILDMSGAALAALVTHAVWRPRYHALIPAGIPRRQIIGPE